MGFDATKPVFGVPDKARLKNWNFDFLLNKYKRCGSDCADAQAGLCLCCSQTPEDRFSRVEAQLCILWSIILETGQHGKQRGTSSFPVLDYSCSSVTQNWSFRTPQLSQSSCILTNSNSTTIEKHTRKN